MKINIVLPENMNIPIGGYKLIFQYANEFLSLGNDITIFFLAGIKQDKSSFYNFIRFYHRKFFNKQKYRQVNWFNFDNGIKLKFDVKKRSEIDDADIVIATSASTSAFTNNLDESKGKKIYFIQNLEAWQGRSLEKVYDTYRYRKMHKVVIANWLASEVEKATGDRPPIVPNFIDNSEFYLENSLSGRRNVVSLLNHTQETKRTTFGIEILKEVKKIVPDLEVRLFGVYAEPENLPNYFHYYFQPTRNQMRKEIYGESKIYFMPTILEGWSLTGMEAMASGAMVLGSDIGGLRDYCFNGSNSILIDQNNKKEFVSSIVKYLSNDAIRIKLVEQSLKDMNRYSLQKSSKIFLDIISSVTNN
ncbi:glycosyltransferase family 4 protein [Oenococcus oeni]|uniref:Glycosyltransferase n=1 Tax=Oenococcus oeni TaxID=1247 RepID=A0AAJ2P2C9_OENOE|nr:glycosyltransferase family 4 protein [Oenococcus oeni]MDV7714403.1 glycosyltransferase [Oenococcus oeni]